MKCWEMVANKYGWSCVTRDPEMQYRQTSALAPSGALGQWGWRNVRWVFQ